VIFAKSLSDILKAQQLTIEFLKPIGLNLSEDKTRIGHSMENHTGTSGIIGLNFLSFHFRNIKCSIHRGVKSTRGKKQIFKLITCPSREAVAEHKREVSKLLIKYKSATLGTVLEKLSARIKGWTWYHAITQSTLTFSKLDHWLWKKLWLWAVRRYRNAKKAKLYCFNVRGWSFGYEEKGKTFILNRHDQTNVRKHVKIKAGASIYDGDLIYFAKRLSFSNPRIKNLKNLISKQKFLCSYCEDFLLPGQIIELHHYTNEYSNKNNREKISFVHAHCHDSIHSTK